MKTRIVDPHGDLAFGNYNNLLGTQSLSLPFFCRFVADVSDFVV